MTAAEHCHVQGVGFYGDAVKMGDGEYSQPAEAWVEPAEHCEDHRPETNSREGVECAEHIQVEMRDNSRVETGSRSSIIREETTANTPANTAVTTRAEKMRLMRAKMKEKTVSRKESMFRPVVGEVVVKEVTRRALTKRGQRKMLLAKDVSNKLVQDRSTPMVLIGSNV